MAIVIGADVGDRIPSQAVETILLDPGADVVGDVLADLGAAEIGAWSPGGSAVGSAVEIDAVWKIVRAESSPAFEEIVGRRVVIDDIENRGDAVGMTLADEVFQGGGPSVDQFYREILKRVVAPVVIEGDMAEVELVFVDRHELHGVDAEGF